MYAIQAIRDEPASRLLFLIWSRRCLRAMNHVPRMTYPGEGPTSENPERGGIVAHFSGDQQRGSTLRRRHDVFGSEIGRQMWTCKATRRLDIRSRSPSPFGQPPRRFVRCDPARLRRWCSDRLAKSTGRRSSAQAARNYFFVVDRAHPLCRWPAGHVRYCALPENVSLGHILPFE